MINSFLNKFLPKPINKNFKYTKHYVLNSELNSPLKDYEEEVMFGCGCFWGAEKGFWKLPGVTRTAVGYSGGAVENPNYSSVCTGTTGHAEVVRVVWDKRDIYFSDLLKLFWECHDPTQGNRQGNDLGSQYRSAIFTTNTKNLNLAIASKNHYQKELNKQSLGEISTEIRIHDKFFYAENYHQQYLAKPGARPYCSAQPTKVTLGNFPGSLYKLQEEIWKEYDWNINHCVLRSNNNKIEINSNKQ